MDGSYHIRDDLGVAAEIRRFGRSAIPAEVAAAVQAELEPALAATRPGGDGFTGERTRRPGALLATCPSSVDMVADDLVLSVADEVLWPDKTTFQLHLTQAIALDPGQSAQALHRDQWAFDFFEFPAEVEVEVSTIWALTDFTEENGATRVAPGANHLPDSEVGTIRHEDTVPAEMPRGSVVVYTGRTVHGGGANLSESTRIGINVDYVLGWLRQEENQYLSVPREVARELPERVQRLMGYQMGAYALGYVGDLRDPITALRDPDGSEPGSAPSFATGD
jgi:ectoine hydroxylase-related dioxygenase (phytanoyl-CoA dioxygenase family)